MSENMHAFSDENHIIGVALGCATVSVLLYKGGVSGYSTILLILILTFGMATFVNMHKERADRERADKERADRERADKERADRERADRERADGERADGERADRERADKERADRERADRERADKERADRERADRERARLARERHRALNRYAMLAREMQQLVENVGCDVLGCAENVPMDPYYFHLKRRRYNGKDPGDPDPDSLLTELVEKLEKRSRRFQLPLAARSAFQCTVCYGVSSTLYSCQNGHSVCG
jgi:hypothetical protein